MILKEPDCAAPAEQMASTEATPMLQATSAASTLGSAATTAEHAAQPAGVHMLQLPSAASVPDAGSRDIVVA